MSDLHEYTAKPISRFILRAADYHPIKKTEPVHEKTNETNKRPSKTQIRLGESESLLCAQ